MPKHGSVTKLRKIVLPGETGNTSYYYNYLLYVNNFLIRYQGIPSDENSTYMPDLIVLNGNEARPYPGNDIFSGWKDLGSPAELIGELTKFSLMDPDCFSEDVIGKFLESTDDGILETSEARTKLYGELARALYLIKISMLKTYGHLKLIGEGLSVADTGDAEENDPSLPDTDMVHRLFSDLKSPQMDLKHYICVFTIYQTIPFMSCKLYKRVSPFTSAEIKAQLSLEYPGEFALTGGEGILITKDQYERLEKLMEAHNNAPDLQTSVREQISGILNGSMQ